MSQAVSQINSYIETVKQLEEEGIPQEFTNVNLSEAAARPLFTEQDPEIKAKAISAIAHTLNSEKERATMRLKPKRIQERDVKKVIQLFKKPAPTTQASQTCDGPFQSSSRPYVLSE